MGVWQGEGTTGSVLPIGLVRPKAEIEALAVAWGQSRYRADQIVRWVFRRGVSDPRAMTDLPAGLRDTLAEVAWQQVMETRALQHDPDGTVKGLLELRGGAAAPAEIEAVLIPAGNRLTLCLSSQAGCAIGCPFCATGRMGLRRNLQPGEIAAQVAWARSVAGRWPSHVVFMGMGEPLARYAVVRQAIELLRGPGGFGIGTRRITISTAGVVPGIQALAAEPALQVGLAVSLHAPDDALRDRLVPLNRRWPLEGLLSAVREYTRATRRRVSFEYVLLAGINDSPAQARLLARRIEGMLAHVNLLAYNPVPGVPFEPSDERAAQAFGATLKARGIAVTLRRPRGRRIDAACGQLGARHVTANVSRG